MELVMVFCYRLPEELRELSEDTRKQLVSEMVEAHDKLCDNPEYSFGIDVDDNIGVFVAHFRTPSETITFAAKNFYECVKKVCGKVLATSIPKIEGVCTYGVNGAENLGLEILKVCEDAAFGKLKNDKCPCKS